MTLYVAQATPDACGPAALAMALASLGVEADPSALIDAVCRDERGRMLARTHLLAAEAISRGLDAVIVRAENDDVPAACLAAGCAVILHHRVRQRSGVGHYSFLLSWTATDVVRHDPLVGPSEAATRAEFLHLWRGRILVAIAPRSAEAAVAVCAACRGAFRLSPAVAARAATMVHCPACDWPLPRAMLPKGGVG